MSTKGKAIVDKKTLHLLDEATDTAGYRARRTMCGKPDRYRWLAPDWQLVNCKECLAKKPATQPS